MSYPALIHPLVIEDETDVQDGYDFIFDEIRKTMPVAPTSYAFSYQEGLRYVRSEKIFHLVILDLRLPEIYGLPAPEGIDLGLSLLGHCVSRDDYPIPALLVISGQLDKAQQETLHQTVRDGFAYGRVLVKANLEALQDALLSAVNAAGVHCALGLHLRASGQARYPTISPREEDLLRRAVAQQSSIGLDLKWWSADPYGLTSAERAWTKVLVGRFLFGGDAPSRLNFFKLVPGTGAEHTVESARRMQSKLPHIKVNSAIVSGSRALLITERVGTGDHPPVSLGEFLPTGAASNPATLAAIAEQIRAQLSALGEIGPQMKSVRQLVWPWHDLARTTAQWEKLRDGATQTLSRPGPDPMELLTQLTLCNKSVRVEYQSRVHGDLHVSNVAVDVSNTAVDAYIFDCAGGLGHVYFRDLAHLEVSVLLHQVAAEGGLVRFCEPFYESFLPAEAIQAASPVFLNTWMFIRQIRAAVGARNQELYALLVFDYAMVQLGGMAFGLSQNKVCDATEAALLATFSASWYETLRSANSNGASEKPV
jgi:CheY-like chemotaxis protein